jgi:hypothetical protein
MATKNAINNQSGELTIDPGASGDSFIQFDINTTGEFRIGVDDTDDSFRISQGSALGTTDTFVMTAAGERTMPLQPAFSAFLGTTDTDVTGNGGDYQMGATGNALTEIFDQGGDLGATGVFTAPITARYQLSYGYLILEAATANNLDPNITTSNRTFRTFQADPPAIEVGGAFGLNATSYADMDAADTAIARMNVSGLVGDTSDVFGAATDPRTFFCGSLTV